MLLNHRRALAYATAAAVVVAVLLVAMAVPGTRSLVQQVDDAYLDCMLAVRNPPLTWLALAFDLLGSIWVTAPLRLAVAGLLAARRRWAQLSAFLLIVFTSELATTVLKALYARPRPPASALVEGVRTSGWSFPSGHAVAGAVTAISVVIVLIPPGRARLVWEMRAAVFSFLMAASRAYLAAHWLSDAVAGTLLGVSIALAWPAVVHEMRDLQALLRASAHPSPPEP